MAARKPKAAPMRWFRVVYHPTSTSGVPIPNARGDEFAKEVEAASRSAAEAAALKLIGHPCLIVETQRLDDKPPSPKVRARRKVSALAGLAISRADGSTAPVAGLDRVGLSVQPLPRTSR